MLRISLRIISAICLLTIVISVFQLSPPKISPFNLISASILQLENTAPFSEMQKEKVGKGVSDARKLYEFERNGHIKMILISYIGLFAVCIATLTLSFLPATKIQAQQDAAANP
jgi:hypothetical protein